LEDNCLQQKYLLYIRPNFITSKALSGKRWMKVAIYLSLEFNMDRHYWSLLLENAIRESIIYWRDSCNPMDGVRHGGGAAMITAKQGGAYTVLSKTLEWRRHLGPFKKYQFERKATMQRQCRHHFIACQVWVCGGEAVA